MKLNTNHTGSLNKTVDTFKKVESLPKLNKNVRLHVITIHRYKIKWET